MAAVDWLRSVSWKHASWQVPTTSDHPVKTVWIKLRCLSDLTCTLLRSCFTNISPWSAVLPKAGCFSSVEKLTLYVTQYFSLTLNRLRHLPHWKKGLTYFWSWMQTFPWQTTCCPLFFFHFQADQTFLNNCRYTTGPSPRHWKRRLVGSSCFS